MVKPFDLTRAIRKHPDQVELEEVWKKRRNRFRILVCVDGSDASYAGLRFAARIGNSSECDIILVYVRPIDHGLRSGGLQVRVARENMLDWGLELPSVKYLKRGLDMLADQDETLTHWTTYISHTDTWGDPLGDNKVEYRHKSGKSVVLKLKTAPDPASGILDQYELGPYNLIIMGEPKYWRSEIWSFFNVSVAQKVAMLAPCSVMVARTNIDNNDKGHLICTDGTRHSLDAMRRDAVLAKHSGSPVSLLCVARQESEIPMAQRVIARSVEMLAKIDIDVQETHVGLGNPVEEIVRVGNDYSLIVVADSGRNSFKRLFVSGVAFKVMGAARTSVLNVR